MSASVHCPTCGSSSSVRETRRLDVAQTKRRRVCDSVTCGKRFTTVEFIVDGPDKNDCRGQVTVVSRRELERCLETLRRMLGAEASA